MHVHGEMSLTGSTVTTIDESLEARYARLGLLRQNNAYDVALPVAGGNQQIVTTTYLPAAGKRYALLGAGFSANVPGFGFISYDDDGMGGKFLPFYLRAGELFIYKGNGDIFSIADKPISIMFKPSVITPETNFGASAVGYGWLRYAEI